MNGWDDYDLPNDPRRRTRNLATIAAALAMAVLGVAAAMWWTGRLPWIG